ncbi:MAG: carbonic anhydrase, partial [Pseudomonadota bacterium]
ACNLRQNLCKGSRMPALKELFEGYRRFRHGTWTGDRARYVALGEGQQPGAMIIGCADSRVDPATIFDTVPGQTFVVRNVANLVPPYERGGGLHGVSAALEYAVKSLKVRYIIVMGHGGCGGIRAALAQARNEDVGEFVGPWVSIAAKARDRVMADYPDADDNTLASLLEREVIAASLNNLLTFPFVREAVAEGWLSLQAGWFAIASGELHWRDEDTGRFSVVDA